MTGGQHCVICRRKRFDVKIYKVPKNDEKRKLWSDATGMALDERNSICETHFAISDFKSTSNSKRRRLHPNAVPIKIFRYTEHGPKVDNGRDFNSQTENCIIESQQTLENLQLKERISILENENELLKERIIYLENIEQNAKKIFTPTQLKQLLHEDRQARWNENDISQAICFYTAGPRAYRYLYEKGFPLPSERTLQYWQKKVDIKPGPLDFVFSLMKNVIDFSEKDKLCVISFDEMKMASNDTLPCSYAQVVMVLGLWKSWKQPVYYDFDQPMTTDILKAIIEKLYCAGYSVVAMVSDLGPGKYQLWNNLKITPEKTWFEHPSNPDLKIFVFADAPHLLNHIRYHFLDSGLVVDDKILSAETIKQTMNHTSSSDLSILWKVTEKHLTVRSAERQRVKLAAQIFSHTTASAIRQCATLGLDLYYPIETANFIDLVNDWFDVFTSNTKLSSSNAIATKQPFGTQLEKQRSVLSDMSALMSKPIIPNKKSWLPFQRGITISNTSLEQLFLYLKEKYDMEYMLTSRLQQDQLEDFFNAMRANGNLNDHPSSMQFKYRMRKYIMGKIK